MITVYGFSEQRLSSRKSCNFDILLTEKDSKVQFELKATPLNGKAKDGENCLHRDMIPLTSLEEEKFASTVVRDHILFSNLQSLESTLTEPTFREKGVQGYWKVSDDDLYAS